MKKVCATCKHDGVEPCNEPCISCRYGSDGIPTEWEVAKHYEPQTNADRIRAMSNEQLAKLFMDFAVICYNDCGVSAEIITTDYVMELLKQPAEEYQHKHFPNGDCK